MEILFELMVAGSNFTLFCFHSTGVLHVNDLILKDKIKKLMKLFTDGTEHVIMV